MLVVQCFQHLCVGWFWGLESTMRQVLQPVLLMMHDDDAMCMIVRFMRFKLQCICNELIYAQKKMQGSQPFLSWVFTGPSPLYNG
jgi:hypothetical protein